MNDSEVVRFHDNEPKDYKYPTCLSCPPPDFTDEALKLKYWGTAHLVVQISSDGFPTRISVNQGLTCGLTARAIEAVQQWKFRAAESPDGKSIAAQVEVEVTFRLF